mmetsp:Transcript_47853/g.86311  ORF Transcript_47853/g.86311 Transcript_47853/m.86311 type:complete len:263 (+) Transcript_47853:356-1144(+)
MQVDQEDDSFILEFSHVIQESTTTGASWPDMSASFLQDLQSLFNILFVYALVDHSSRDWQSGQASQQVVEVAVTHLNEIVVSLSKGFTEDEAEVVLFHGNFLLADQGHIEGVQNDCKQHLLVINHPSQLVLCLHLLFSKLLDEIQHFLNEFQPFQVWSHLTDVVLTGHKSHGRLPRMHLFPIHLDAAKLVTIRKLLLFQLQSGTEDFHFLLRLLLCLQEARLATYSSHRASLSTALCWSKMIQLWVGKLVGSGQDVAGNSAA